ncbi:helix-turn-helix domain-containing protein [Streptomyces kaniharaensis]|uniref:Helix-turn-helix domain-containing protein n=1 Tax=Streptomyces kaniharaensis TaxID=212423 RepID=A0A6N7L2N3_9ACTN|nr:helix-turn-helix transcriptional regulator [Streptomyces kaniharaensis]MQS16768.1 helix-turn-helix domain-containing protein [Streptomyces kaniharaensis]
MNKKTVDPTSSPWAPFGIQLRRSREAAGLKQEELAPLCECSPSHLSYVELAHRPPSRSLAELADKALQTGGTLMLMWWQLKHTAILEGFPEYARYEALAEQIRIFEIDVIPGLLQTRAYATAIEMGYARQGGATLEQAEERIEFRLARQQVLERIPTPLLHTVLDESCLRRIVGGRDVMVGQLLHLEQMAKRPNVVIQVAPYSLGENRPFTRVAHLLTMPNRKILAYGEIEQRGYIDRDSQSVAALTKSYDRLAVEALGQAESLTLIRSARRDFEWMST